MTTAPYAEMTASDTGRPFRKEVTHAITLQTGCSGDEVVQMKIGLSDRLDQARSKHATIICLSDSDLASRSYLILRKLLLNRATAGAELLVRADSSRPGRNRPVSRRDNA